MYLGHQNGPEEENELPGSSGLYLPAGPSDQGKIKAHLHMRVKKLKCRVPHLLQAPPNEKGLTPLGGTLSRSIKK